MSFRYSRLCCNWKHEGAWTALNLPLRLQLAHSIYPYLGQDEHMKWVKFSISSTEHENIRCMGCSGVANMLLAGVDHLFLEKWIKVRSEANFRFHRVFWTLENIRLYRLHWICSFSVSWHSQFTLTSLESKMQSKSNFNFVLGLLHLKHEGIWTALDLPL